MMKKVLHIAAFAGLLAPAALTAQELTFGSIHSPDTLIVAPFGHPGAATAATAAEGTGTHAPSRQVAVSRSASTPSAQPVGRRSAPAPRPAQSTIQQTWVIGVYR